jgi:release factor glutamine methyltransferase
MQLSVRQALVQCGLIPLEAQVLLAHLLGRDRAWLVAHATDALPRDRADAFFALARRRRDGGEPIAYLTGFREFWGMTLAVTPNVLIPRPETETLVERALARLPADRALRILDLGTGSGAIALALARERPLAQVLATDVSDAALLVARANARRVNAHNVEFVHADWYADLPAAEVPYDLIASNPPYIAAGDRHLAEGDVRFEPMAALVSGGDGLDALRAIVAGAAERLAPEGWLIVEHGYDQAQSVRELFAAAGFTSLESTRDLAGIQRVMAGRRPPG